MPKHHRGASEWPFLAALVTGPRVALAWTALLTMGWATPASAQPTARLVLSWSAPPGCPTREAIQARVDALLGGQASSSTVAGARANGQVERTSSGYRLLLRMGPGDGQSSRVIDAGTCEELAGAAAIAIALLARSTAGATTGSAGTDGEATSTSTSTPAGAASESATEATPPAVPEPPKKPEGAESHDDAAQASASSARAKFVLDVPVGALGWGSLPQVELGLGAGLGLRWKALRVVASGTLWHKQSAEVSGFGARFGLQTARVEGCLLQSAYGFELGPCAGIAVERLVGEAEASSILTSTARSAVWVAGSGGVFASLPTPGFPLLRFFANATVLIPTSRPRFVIDHLGPIHQPALAAPRLDFGCEWIF